MSEEMHLILAEAYPLDVVDGIDNALIEAIWHELDGQLPRKRVGCVVAEIALEFQSATVKTFIPIFVHRRALEQLRTELNEMAFIQGHFTNEQ